MNKRQKRRHGDGFTMIWVDEAQQFGIDAAWPKCRCWFCRLARALRPLHWRWHELQCRWLCLFLTLERGSVDADKANRMAMGGQWPPLLTPREWHEAPPSVQEMYDFRADNTFEFNPHRRHL